MELLAFYDVRRNKWDDVAVICLFIHWSVLRLNQYCRSTFQFIDNKKILWHSTAVSNYCGYCSGPSLKGPSRQQHLLFREYQNTKTLQQFDLSASNFKLKFLCLFLLLKIIFCCCVLIISKKNLNISVNFWGIDETPFKNGILNFDEKSKKIEIFKFLEKFIFCRRWKKYRVDVFRVTFLTTCLSIGKRKFECLCRFLRNRRKTVQKWNFWSTNFREKNL